jgi:anti-sigma factor RsiW
MAKRPLAWAASIVLALSSFAGGAMWGGGSHSERSELIEEVAGYHPIYSRDSDHLVEVSADQTDHIAAWLGGHLALRLVIPDLADAGLQFAGGRMLVVNHRPVAQLMYTRHRGLPVALCVTRMDGSPTPVGIAARGPLRLGSWEDGSFAYVLVGEIEESEVIHLTERVRAQLGA